jgi:hypothetical protein
MNITAPMRNRRSERPSKDAMLEASDRVAIWTNSWHGGSLRIKWSRLGDGEARSLAELTRVGAYGGGFVPARLDETQRAEFETLVEKGAGLGPGWFERTREQAGLTREVRKLLAEASRPRQPTVAEEDRLVRMLHDLVKRRALHIDRVGVYMYLLGQIISYEAVAPGAFVEGADDSTTLVLRRNLGLGANHDPTFNATSRWEEAVEQLDRNGLLEVEHLGGPEVRVRMGWRTLKALGRPSRKGRAS